MDILLLHLLQPRQEHMKSSSITGSEKTKTSYSHPDIFKMRRLAIFLLLLFSIIHHGYSQHGSNAYRDLADSLYRNHHYQYAADYYEKALKKTKQPGYLMLQLGKSYDKISKPAIAEKWFRQASANKAAFTDEDFYLFAESLIAQQKIAAADSLLERMLQKNPNSNLTRTALADVRNFEKFYRDSHLVPKYHWFYYLKRSVRERKFDRQYQWIIWSAKK